jgi:dTDP-4-amino-4,6-dideoxygalactose transaminase
MDIARRHSLYVIEDAAQGFMSTYKGRPLGSIGHLATYSFHETKNYTSGGEGGLLIINDQMFEQRAEIIREKGTNRSQFFRGMVDKYTWVDIGSSYLPSELQAAYLYGQLERSGEIYEARLSTWSKYYELLKPYEADGIFDLPYVPDECSHNAHMFYVKFKDLTARTLAMQALHDSHILAVFHYIPLHSSPAGKSYGRFNGKDYYTTSESERLLRLPMWLGLDQKTVQDCASVIAKFLK